MNSTWYRGLSSSGRQMGESVVRRGIKKDVLK